jgi:cyclohexyl-isocyanide hydratase
VNRRTFARRTAAALIALRAGSAWSADPVDPLTALRRKPLDIGILIYPRMDQIDFTGPFAVLSRLPDSTIHVIAHERGPIRDHKGLILTAETSLADVPRLDVLQIPGGPGQEALMEDEQVLSLIRKQHASGGVIFSVCTGALICGAAGILRGRRATTHWAAFDLLRYFGATPIDSRVVVDGNVVSAAGVTAGIDGALRLASLVRSKQVAQEIQLDIQYAPEPPFDAGNPKRAPRDVFAAVNARYRPLTDARQLTARKVAARLGLPTS